MFSPSPSGAHMLGRRALAACGSPSSLNTCKRGWAGPPPHAGGWRMEGLPCDRVLPAILPLLALLSFWQCCLSQAFVPLPSFHQGGILSPTALFWELCIHVQPWVYMIKSNSADVPLTGHVAVGSASLIFPWSEAPLAKEVLSSHS